MCFSSTAVHVLDNQAVFGTVSNKQSRETARGKKENTQTNQSLTVLNHLDSIYIISQLCNSSGAEICLLSLFLKSSISF